MAGNTVWSHIACDFTFYELLYAYFYRYLLNASVYDVVLLSTVHRIRWYPGWWRHFHVLLGEFFISTSSSWLGWFLHIRWWLGLDNGWFFRRRVTDVGRRRHPQRRRRLACFVCTHWLDQSSRHLTDSHRQQSANSVLFTLAKWPETLCLCDVNFV